MPRSCAATEEQRVLVLVFEDQRNVLPRRVSTGMPLFLILQLCGQIQQIEISSGVKSFNVRKSRPLNPWCVPP